MKRMAAYSMAIALVVPALLCGWPVQSRAQEITLIAGGDIEWSRVTKAPGLITYPPASSGQSGYPQVEENAWIPVPYVLTDQTRPFLEQKLGHPLEGPQSHHIASIHYGLEFDSPVEMARYPFRNIAPVLREADIAFANLEIPLSDRARNSGAFEVSTAFADGLRWAGIDVVSTANNHALDAEGEGLIDTKAALREAGIGGVGTGINLEDARRPYIIERDGIKVAFLGYSQFVNVGNSGFALDDYPGVVPLDPFIIKEDIRRVRDQVDYVAVAFHWAIENSQETHPMAREFAHDIIDAGADIILGGHPHVPRGVETYKGKVIFYCFGNLIFGHNHTYWMDNYLGRLRLARDGIKQVEILPIAGRGTGLSQPYLLDGAEAQALLKDVQDRSAKLDTRMEIVGDAGIITP